VFMYDKDARRYCVNAVYAATLCSIYARSSLPMRLYDSMYEYVRVCTSTYQQGRKIHDLHIFIFTLGSKIQCAVLKRCLSAFINNRKSFEGMTKLSCPCFCEYQVYARIYSAYTRIYVAIMSCQNSFSKCIPFFYSTIRS
jgi:hypothetical protein